MTRTRKELMQIMIENTHALWNTDFLDEVNQAFGTKIEPREYVEDGDRNPKGLTLNERAKSANGIACFELVPLLCASLNVKYPSMFGRGFQVRACIDALKAAGFDT